MVTEFRCGGYNCRQLQGRGGKPEIAALAVDFSSIKLVAAAIGALNMTNIEQNKIAADGGGEMVDVLGDVANEVEELLG